MVYKFSNTLRKFLLQVKNRIYGLEDKYFMNEDICLPQGSFLLYIEPLYLYGYVYLLSIINIIIMGLFYVHEIPILNGSKQTHMLYGLSYMYLAHLICMYINLTYYISTAQCGSLQYCVQGRRVW